MSKILRVMIRKLRGRQSSQVLISLAIFINTLAGGLATPCYSQTLGQKNNNPINLKGAHLNWKGAEGQDKFGHVYFKSLNYGIRAGLKNLTTAQKRYPNRTLHNYLSTRFAEKNGTYEARYIAKKLNVSPYAELKDLNMEKVIIHLAKIESRMRITAEQVQDAKSL